YASKRPGLRLFPYGPPLGWAIPSGDRRIDPVERRSAASGADRSGVHPAVHYPFFPLACRMGRPVAGSASLGEQTGSATTRCALEEAQEELQALNTEIRGRNGDLEEANARLEALATTDGMTGLPNHRAFQETLRESLNHATRTEMSISLLLLDVDHFKQYNDS